MLINHMTEQKGNEHVSILFDQICMNQTCVSIGPMIGNTLQCPRNNQNEECSGNGVS